MHAVSPPKSELAVAVWGAITLGALLASFMVFRPVRDSLVLDSDPDRLPQLFTATFVVTTAIAPLWGRAVSKHPRRVVPLSFHVFALCALVFVLLEWQHVA